VNVKNKQPQIFVANEEMVLQPGGLAGGKNPHMGRDLA